MSDNRMMLAYVDRAEDERVNAARRAEARAARNTCNVDGLRWKMVDWYNKRQRYTHAEVTFPKSALDLLDVAQYDKVRRHRRVTSTKDSLLAFASFGGEGVQVIERSFTSDGYRFMEINVTPQQQKAALKFAVRQLGKPYDDDGASWRLLMWPAAPTTKKWWCASLAHAILQKVGLMLDAPLNHLAVDDIVHMVKRSGRKCDVSGTPRMWNGVHSTVGEAMFGAYVQGPSAVSGYLGDVADTVDESCRNVMELGLDTRFADDDDQDANGRSSAKSNRSLLRDRK